MIELMEETANMLRGVCMDPRIPQDTKEALWSRVRKLDAATEAAADDDCGADKEIERLKAEAAKSERRAADLCAAARAAARDCRTCAHHTYASGGCVSALRCVGGDRYQPTQPRQLWEQQPPKPAPF